MIYEVENILPKGLQNTNDCSNEEIVDRKEYCIMLKKRIFGDANCYNVDDVTYVEAEIELNWVKFIYIIFTY